MDFPSFERIWRQASSVFFFPLQKSREEANVPIHTRYFESHKLLRGVLGKGACMNPACLQFEIKKRKKRKKICCAMRFALRCLAAPGLPRYNLEHTLHSQVSAGDVERTHHEPT